MHVHEKLFIGGDWVAPSSTATIDVVSPHTEQVIGRVPEAQRADVDAAVAAARQAFDHGEWPRLSAAERADRLAVLFGLYAARCNDIAQIITEEMGSPISFSQLAQAPAPLMALDYFVNLARTYPFEEVRPGMLGPTVVRQVPVGVVAAIVPWNVPQLVTMFKVAPALAAGCTVVLKPAPETPLDAYLLAELVVEAGLPPGVLNIVPAGREVGEHLVTHPGVDKVAFTGSTVAGRRIGALCGELLRPCTLELGGKSAAIICADADLGATVAGLQFASFMNNGQACVAQTRILAPRERHDEVVDALVEMVRSMPVGDPMDPATQVGPLVAARQRDRVLGYIALGQDEGAKVAIGGGRPAGLDTGWYVEPTVIVNVENRMRIAQEEIFGPVVAVIPYDTVDDAVAIANDSDFGLAGTVWTEDLDAGLAIARRVRTGTYGVNYYNMDFGAPFGGFKQSGLGRELGPEGLSHYLEHQSVAMPAGWELPA